MIRTPSGKWVRPSPEVTENLEKKITSFKISVRRGELLLTLKEHPAWMEIQKIISERLDSVKRKLDKNEAIDARQVDLLVQQQNDLEGFLSVVDDFVESRSGFESLIDQYEKDLSARKQPVAG